MKTFRTFSTIVEALELPQIVQLGAGMYGACFSLMKLLPARFMLDRARDAGLLTPGGMVVETTSGTYGLALAMLCALRGYSLTVVSDPAIDEPLRHRLADLGVRVEMVTRPAEKGGFQKPRMEKLAAIRAQNPLAFWPSQYDNPHNAGGYARFAEHLAETLGRIDCLVATVGSGGSACGTARYLRHLFPKLHLIGVDTQGSVIFGQPDGKRVLRGLGNSLMPKNVDHSCFDEVHWVTAPEAYCATRALHQQHALYMGGTSGAAYMVARWWSNQHPDSTVVALFPDQGHRYESTIYSDLWLHREGLWRQQLPTHPIPVNDPRGVPPEWSRILWNRRSYEDVVGQPCGEKQLLAA
ncbi:MAG TPA: cysteine synthase family protein [Candidatus Polarisedimenticolia bacterium]|jgi:cysteine synthase|nr:cysteine synthase family protein [Candidatus Polarisedimenticolia bacterium]